MADSKGAAQILRVNVADLERKGTALTDGYPTWSQAGPNAPCLLALSTAGAERLQATHQRLSAVLKRGAYEAEHLASRFHAAAKAYDNTDAVLKEQIESGSPSGADAPPLAPAPTFTGPAAGPTAGAGGGPGGDNGVKWPDAVAQFNAGDQTQGLRDYQKSLYDLKQALLEHSTKFSMGGVYWEGSGGDAAGTALRAHESWMFKTRENIDKYIAQIGAFVDAHVGEHAQHPTQSDIDYVNGLRDQPDKYFKEYADRQTKSDDVRNAYSSKLDFQPIEFQNPPLGPSSPDSKTSSPPGAPGGGQPGGGGGQQGGEKPGGEQPQAGQTEASAPLDGGGQSQGGGSPQSGGGAGGGKPEGGGSPSGGAPGGGMPSGLGDMPKMPDGPGVSPAGLGGGGAGGGSAGGGGGLGGQPMQPAATAPGLAAGAGPGGSNAAAGKPPLGGGAGGGMGGGMGGMGHGGKGEGGKEKKRNPSLSPDEALYVEDRAYTAGPIGHRRRTKIEDTKDSK